MQSALLHADFDPATAIHDRFINIEDPNIINERVIVRIRCFYDNMDRITKGHEIEHFFELNDALRKS